MRLPSPADVFGSAQYSTDNILNAYQYQINITKWGTDKTMTGRKVAIFTHACVTL